MSDNNFSIVLQTIFEKAGVQKNLQDIQKIINQHPVEFITKLESASLKNEINKVSKELASSLNNIPDLNIKVTDKDIKNAFKSIQKQNDILGNELNKTVAKIHELQSTKSISLNFTKAETEYKKLESLGLITNDVKQDFNNLKIAMSELNLSSNDNNLVTNYTKFNAQLKTVENSMKQVKVQSSATVAKIHELERINLSNSMEAWLKSNSAASKKFGTQINNLMQECKTCDAVRFGNIKKEFQSITKEAQIAGVTGKNLKDTLASGMQKFSEWGIVSRLVMGAVQSVKNMTTNVIDLNSEMTELDKVSDATAQQLESTFINAKKNAKEYGAAIKDVISSTSDWSRLGYSLPDAEKLAQIAILYKNVGDGIDIDTANKSLVSTLQGYQLDANEALSIIDKFNEVANNYAIDSAGIGEALQHSAASFYAANTDLSKSIALITGTNAVVQDESVVGNMWKTVSMRIRGATTELEEAGLETDGMVQSTSQLRDIIQGMTGFDIMKDENTFKDIYDIVVGIGKEWGNLSDINQASLLEKLAGKRQGNALAAALNNVSTIEDAYKTAENSAGSAMKEQEKYEKSVQYSLDRLGASFEGLSNTLIDSNLLKFFAELGVTGVGALDGITDKIGLLGIALTGLTAYKSIKGGGRPKMSGFNNLNMPSVVPNREMNEFCIAA